MSPSHNRGYSCIDMSRLSMRERGAIEDLDDQTTIGKRNMFEVNLDDHLLC